MYTATEDLKKGIEVDIVKYRDTVARYQCSLSDACLKLYDMCYLGSPSELDDVEVKRGIIQEFPEYCKYLMNYTTGVYSWSEQMMLYAQYKTRGTKRGSEFGEVIACFSQALRAREALELLNNIAIKININAKRPKVLKPRFTTSEWLKDISVFNCNSSVIMEIAKRKDNTRIVEVNTISDVRDYLITEYMRISPEKLAKRVSGNAFFVKGLTRSEELKIFYLIVINAVECDTHFGKAYEAKRMKEATELFENKKARRQEPFESVVFQATRDKRSTKIAKEREKYKQGGCKTFFMDASSVYFEVETKVSTQASIQTDKPENGKYAIDYTTGHQFQMFNLLDGVSGEFISAKEVERQGYCPIVSAVPIRSISVDRGVPAVNIDWYYPIYGVLYNDAQNDAGEFISKSLIPLVGDKIRLREVKEDALLKYFDAKNRLELFDSVRQRLRLEFKVPAPYYEGYKDYVADLVCAFMYLNFCQRDYEFRNTFYDFLSDEMKLKAFVDAQRQFENFKI